MLSASSIWTFIVVGVGGSGGPGGRYSVVTDCDGTVGGGGGVGILVGLLAESSIFSPIITDGGPSGDRVPALGGRFALGAVATAP